MSRQGQARARTVDNVLDFWNAEAREWGENPQVTIRDHYFRLLEMEAISDLLRGRTEALDIGCGTGFSTLFYAQHAESIIGADGAEEMVAHARRFLEDPAYFDQIMEQFVLDGRPKLRGNLRFEQANIVAMPYPENAFDAVVAERVLINLPTRALQDQAVREVARVLRPGGLWALVEVTEQGHRRVDELRTRFGLSTLEKYWHNLYVEENLFLLGVKQAGFEIADIRRFETYQFLTKVIHPLVVWPEEPRFFSNFNRAAALMGRVYPTYASVQPVELRTFLTETFARVLSSQAAEFLPGYHRAIPKILDAGPNFSGCSHQVLFVLKKV